MQMTHNIIKKIILFTTLYFFIPSIVYGVVFTDDFESGRNGWSNNSSSVIYYDSPINSNVYRLDRNNEWVKKTYQLGSAYANQPVTIEFDMWAVGGWESSGSFADYFYVQANGTNLVDGETIPGTDGDENVVYKHFILSGTTDSNGDLELRIKQDVSYIGGERAHIDNIVVAGGGANLKLTEYRAPNPNPASVGQNITFYIRINNLGSDNAQGNIVLSATYNQPVTIISATQVSGGGDFSCSNDGTTITCIKTNQMNNGAPNKDFEFVVQPTTSHILTQTAHVESTTTPDPDTQNNTLNSSVALDVANIPPVMSYIPDQTTIIGELYSLDLQNYVTVTDGDPIIQYHLTCTPAGLTFDTSTGQLIGTPTSVSTYNCSATAEDKDGISNASDFRLIVESTQITDSARLPFTLINPAHTRNVIGNYAIAGNTMLCLTEKTRGYGGTCHGNDSNYDMITSNMHVVKYLDIDDNASTWNSTSSYINLPDKFDPNVGILWAGLFWQGRLAWDRDYDIHYAVSNGSGYEFVETGRGTNGNAVDLTTTSALHLKLKVDDSDYRDISASRFHHYDSSNGSTYAAFADITPYVKEMIKSKGKHVFTVANLFNGEGREPSPGLFGGWSIVVIYGEEYTGGTPRNISIYNGFISIGQNDDPIKISGFKVPRENDVSAQLSVFSGEGEYLYGYNPNNNAQDWMKISNQQGGNYQYLPGVPDGTGLPNKNNMFDAHLDNILRDHIDGKYNDQSRNNVGIDVDNYDLSEIMTQYRDLNQNINEVYIKTFSNNDYITPSMIAFSAELYVPNVCYDFVSRLNEFVIPYKEVPAYRARANEDDELSVTVAIWDISGDIDPRYVSVGLKMHQTKGRVTPVRSPRDKAFYSYPNGNTLIATDYADMSTPSRPVITIGHDRTDNVGGIIKPDERYFTKFYFNVDDANESLISGNFDVEVNATMNYGSGDFWQIMNIRRCAQNPTYSPTWVQFNTEQVFTGNVPTDPTRHYSLPTRIAGRDFNYAVAAYGKDMNDEYTVPTPADGITVDVELIDISAFDDNNSFFKCSNPSPNIIMKPGTFVYFENESTRLDVTDPNDLANTRAVRNATFRMWLLTEENGTLIPSDRFYPKSDNAYYGALYTNKFQARDTKRICLSACTPPYDYTSTRASIGENADPSAVGCYACLRDNFAQPFCARDNFAIRPKAIKVDIGDRGVDGNLSSIGIARNITRSTEPNDLITIAAGYPYELNMTTMNDSDIPVSGYTTLETYTEQDSLTVLPNKTDESAQLLSFTGLSSCNEKVHRTLALVFTKGLANGRLKLKNTSSYQFEVWDSNWTIVDRAYHNPYKTLFTNNCANSNDPACNDCIIGTTTADANDEDKVGCTFGSSLTDLSGTQQNSYTPVNITVNPYRFALDVALRNEPDTATLAHPNWTYMNDLTKSQGMAIVIDGNITALGADGNRTTNYTAGCSAQPSLFWLDRNMSTPETTITTENNLKSVYFQQWINADLGTTQPVLDTRNGTDMNSTLTAVNYISDYNGTAHVAIYYNFEKPYDEVVNPVIVTFKTLLTASPNAASYANQRMNYIPDGNISLDANRTYFFAKVDAALGTNDRRIYIPHIASTTTMRVNVYCTDTAIFNCSTIPDLNATAGTAVAEENYLSGGWYRMTTHTTGDGQIISLTSDNTQVVINPSANITLDTNGSSGDIIITYPRNAQRPLHTYITITPDEWLKFSTVSSDNGKPRFLHHFLTQGLKWKGTGKTGHVMETEPTMGNNQRMNW